MSYGAGQYGNGEEVGTELGPNGDVASTDTDGEPVGLEVNTSSVGLLLGPLVGEPLG